MKKAFIFFCFIIVIFSTVVKSENILLREDFNSLENWEPLFFKKIPQHSTYTVVQLGNESYLKAESSSSASALIFKETFDVYLYPFIRWKWKIRNIHEKGNAKIKAGDDYPIRIYIIFKYDPKKSGFFQKLKYNSTRLIYGDYPPHSSLNYIWANKEHNERILVSTYTSKSRMVLIQKGGNNVGKWVGQEANILDDYREAFGELPPSTASIAIMSDSDNTGEKATAYVDFIEIFATQKE